MCKINKIEQNRMCRRTYHWFVFSYNRKEKWNYCMDELLKPDTLLARLQLPTVIDNLKSRISDKKQSHNIVMF